MAKTTETVSEFIINTLTVEQYSKALKNGEIDPNQLYLTPEKQLVVAVTQDQYDEMKQAGTLDEDVIYVTPVSGEISIDSSLSSTSTNAVQNKAIYAALPWEYRATLTPADWVATSSDEQDEGFNYKQTVTPTKTVDVAPDLVARSVFINRSGDSASTGNLSFDMRRKSSVDAIQAGRAMTNNDGTITVYTKTEPEFSVNMSWWIVTV